MWRYLRTDHPADTKQLEPGGIYTWTPAVHHGVGKRWHWVAYPYKLGLGVEPDYLGDRYTQGTTELVATEFTGGTPDWDSVEWYAIPLIFPGLRTWNDLTAESHRRVEAIRNADVTMWELYEKDPASFLE